MKNLLKEYKKIMKYYIGLGFKSPPNRKELEQETDVLDYHVKKRKFKMNTKNFYFKKKETAYVK